MAARNKNQQEDGFSLIEAAIALLVSVILFSMLAVTLQSSFNSARNSRTQQQATAIGNQYIELARSLTWDELAMDATESGDPRIAGINLKADVADIPANEKLVVDSVDGLLDGKFTEVIDGDTFTVWQYVTEVSANELKRVVVFVDWASNGEPRSHHTSTIIAEERKWSTP